MIVTDQLVGSFTTVKGSSTHGAHWASYAVDGDFNQGVDRCFHSGVNETIKEAWLQIDLGRVFSVNSVKLWFRSDEDCTYDDTVHSTSFFEIVSKKLI